MLCTVCYVERVKQDMRSQTGLIGHVGIKSCFRKVLNKYLAYNFNKQTYYTIVLRL